MSEVSAIETGGTSSVVIDVYDAFSWTLIGKEAFSIDL